MENSSNSGSRSDQDSSSGGGGGGAGGLTFTTLQNSNATDTFVVQDQDMMRRRDSEDPSNEDLLGLGGDAGELREQDRFLPIANVARIMKRGIPTEQGKIAKDARECVQECVSEFVSFITSEASDRCQAEKRKTINGEDILFAMSTLGFDNYVEPLKLYLQKYREGMKGENKGAGGDDFDGIGDDLMGPNLQSLSSQQSASQVLLTYGNNAQGGNSFIG